MEINHKVANSMIQQAGITAARGTGTQDAGDISRPEDRDVSGGFASTISSSLARLAQMEQTADTAIQQLAMGEDSDIHDVMIAMQETDIAFRIALAMRDHLVQAYQEVMRMSV